MFNFHLFTRATYKALFLAILTICGIWSAHTATAEGKGRIVKCKLVIDAEEYINAPCKFDPRGNDGSFNIMARNGMYFAAVRIETPGRALGYWNEEPYAGHAHTNLGELKQDGACWVNDRASVCAW
ncbi:hypothetical protein GL286_03675 [Paracoccus aestuariivivens]|uniref:Uncharacterized protein n=1 Tax=Paracoccus aestuariivivens TaxID=1820333 RepID=A0A6L6J9L3_9RHOB|nr:hypothetical protein [Paracoccus aestuariivivens]